MLHLLLLLASLLAGVAWASEPARPFAALQITPYGAQQYDLTTGITTLPEGGQIIDQEAGTVLSGSFVRYHDESFVEIRDAVIATESGNITAQEAYLDLATLVLHASGEVTFVGSEITLNAEMLTAHLTPGVVVAEGSVQSEDPLLRTDTLLLLLPERQALLVGPYTYRSGPLTLSAQSSEDHLTLQWEQEDAETVFHATTETAPDLLARLEPYLP